jgi:hypothetical protein
LPFCSNLSGTRISFLHCTTTGPHNHTHAHVYLNGKMRNPGQERRKKERKKGALIFVHHAFCHLPNYNIHHHILASPKLKTCIIFRICVQYHTPSNHASSINHMQQAYASLPVSEQLERASVRYHPYTHHHIKSHFNSDSSELSFLQATL